MSFFLQAWAIALAVGAFIGTVIVIIGRTRKENR
jgi:hypothetical protein